MHIERSPALPIFPALRARRPIVAVAAFVAALAPFAALADEFSSPLETSNWVFTWGGYVHAAYRWIEQPKNYNLAGRNNGFQLEQARLGANVQYKDQLAVRVSLEGASEDRVNQAFPGGQLTARLRDAYITWAPLRALRLTIGQMVTPWDLDSMRTDAELPFVSRSVPVEGVQPHEGHATRGMGVDRNLGLAIHSGDIGFGSRLSMRYSLFIGNGNGQNQLLNDNNKPAVFGRVEAALWGSEGLPPDQIGPMRAVTDRHRKPIVGVGIAVQYNSRTAGNLPDLINETDVGTAADIVFALYGIDLQAGLLYIRTRHDTLMATPDIERFGWWLHLRYTIPRLPVEITPGYRIASYAPRAHLQTSAPTAMADQMDSDLGLLYHTIGVAIRPTHTFPLHLDINYTVTQESGNNVLDNDRIEADVVAVF